MEHKPNEHTEDSKNMQAGPTPADMEALDTELGTKLNFGGMLTRLFIDSKTTLLIMVAALVFGLLALFITPREENPQISVPSVNVIVPFPGASPHEVENLVIDPLERLIWDIKGVEHVYSMAFPDYGVVTAQFYVGEDQEDSVFKVFETVYSNLDRAPAGSMSPMVKPVDINDVPAVALTLFSPERTTFELRQTAERMLNDLREVPGTGQTVIVGGDDRQITVEIDPVKAAAYAIDPMLIAASLEGANFRLPTDRLEHGGTNVLVRSGQFLRNTEDVGSVVVKTHPFPDGSGSKVIYLRDIATIKDGPGELSNYSRISFGTSGPEMFEGEYHHELDETPGKAYNAVSIAIAKQKGQNAVNIVNAVIARMEELAGQELDAETGWIVTKNEGEKANDAVNELVIHLGWAIVIVLGLLILALGWRDAAVVAVAIPLTLLVTLAVGYLAGQTINRITLFALILSLGLLVDDAIVVVENIHRHLKMRPKGANLIRTCILAVNEISNPTIYATLTVMVSMIPMAFVTGMMGPYMGPIPFNVPVAMLISLLVAFKVTPYLALRWLRVKPFGEGTPVSGNQPRRDPADDEPPVIGEGEACPPDVEHGASPGLLRFFNRTLSPLMESPARRNLLLGSLVVALLICFTFPLLQWVKFRMLPKSNANTFLVTIDMPAGTSLSSTDSLVRDVEDRLLAIPQVANLVTTVGTGSVMDFNGLLRGTNFRNQPHQADIRVNLISKHHRKIASEEIVAAVRPDLHALAQPHNAILKLVEDPPGPPVRATVLAEIYGPYGELQRSLVDKVRGWFENTEGVTDIEDSVSTVADEIHLKVDPEKAAAAGLKVGDVTRSLRAALAGYPLTELHDPAQQVQTPVVLRFPVEYRSRLEDLASIVLPGMHGPVPLSELVRVTHGQADRPIHHKDLQQVSYIGGEMTGRSSVYAVIDLMQASAADPLPPSHKLEWEGEWDLTLKVFRDLGIAMGVAILLIYLILVGRFKSFVDPLVIMGAVPLTMLGVLPGFAILGNFDIYFSATGMIGVIALAGIVVRNSIILIEFIKDALHQGMPLKEAVIFAGAIRTRPIVLTALAAMAGMLVVVRDPVWSGLSWALIFGIIASTSLSLIIIPLLYYTINARPAKNTEAPS
ncbi:MAG TPA: efflux RND transporter permease subunit [Firmicutes bacterium]|nr:efflux RND transporter permease subunit [Bacillota bacterium]